jgi:hypothetical protein
MPPRRSDNAAERLLRAQAMLDQWRKEQRRALLKLQTRRQAKAVLRVAPEVLPLRQAGRKR